MTVAPKKIYVAVIGVGGVGEKVLSQLEAILNQNKSNGSVLTHINLVYIARSSKALLSTAYEPLSLISWAENLAASDARPLPNKALAEYLAKAPGRAVFVDNTTSSEIAQAYPHFLASSVSVVTPSKIAFASGLELWQEIFAAAANGSGPPGAGYIFHESSVGAGLPVISTIKDLLSTGNLVTRVEGVLSGTMSFVFNNFMPPGGGGSTTFSTEVRRAKQHGETEPDPRHDLSGLDVARKCTIIARLCGLTIESPTSFPVQSLIPTELQNCKDGDEFLDRLPEFDGEMDKMKQEAQAAGKVLRYVGSVNVLTGECMAGLQAFDVAHPFASMQGDDLQLNVYTKHYKSPILIGGSGEGAYLGVIADLIRACELSQ